MKKIMTTSLCLATTIFLAFSLTGCSLESDVLRGAKRSSKSLSTFVVNPKTLIYDVMYWAYDETTDRIYYACTYDVVVGDDYTGTYDPAFMQWERGKTKASVYFYDDDLYNLIYSVFDAVWTSDDALGKTDYYGQFTEAQITSILDGANL